MTAHMSKPPRYIGNPPVRVIMATKHSGKWQTVVLAEPTTFRCLICREKRTSAWVAVVAENWRGMACPNCYYTRKTKSQPAPDGRQRIADFFLSAGIPAELRPKKALAINGKKTGPVPNTLPPPGAPGWNSLVDELAIRYAHQEFINSLTENSSFDGDLRAYLRPDEHGFAIKHGSTRVAIVHATHARVRGHDPVIANFLTPGPHWQELASLVRHATPARIPNGEPRTDSPPNGSSVPGDAPAYLPIRHVTQLPNSMDATLRSACTEASRRIREDRQVAYDRPVILESAIGELTLLPARATAGAVRLPFALSTGSGRVTAELAMQDSDPLPLRIGAEVQEQDMILAWACALIGWAEATCIQFESTSVRASTEISQHREPRPRVRRIPRHRPAWPPALTPVGSWQEHSGSFVAGHKRRLTDGQLASDDARQYAQRVGIALQPHETWVRPHARGIPEDIQIRFRWNAPAELDATRISPASAPGPTATTP
jgi:hypothetical protein